MGRIEPSLLFRSTRGSEAGGKMGQWGEDGPRDKWFADDDQQKQTTEKAIVINVKNSPCSQSFLALDYGPRL